MRLNAGAATVILLLTVVGLSLFAVLALKAAHAEEKLASGSAEAVREYYDADAVATETMFRLTEEYAEGGAQYLREKYSGLRAEDTSEDRYIFVIPVNDISYIEMTVGCDSSDGSTPKVLERRLVTRSMDGYAEAGFEITDQYPVR